VNPKVHDFMKVDTLVAGQNSNCVDWSRIMTLIALAGLAMLSRQIASAEDTVRFATFNCSLNRREAGGLLQDLTDDSHPQIRNVARIVRRVKPDVLLLNEFDFESNRAAADSFRNNYLSATVNWCEDEPLDFPFVVCLPVNTGVDSGLDMNHNGMLHDPTDAFGFGNFSGQYGMLLLSRFPIDLESVRTFRKLLWSRMPDAKLPRSVDRPDADWYSSDELEVFRLSSKSHWDVSVSIQDTVIHVLASHPTPPAFDGSEARNGRRNHDEIRLWSEYVSKSPGDWLRDDAGIAGGLRPAAPFVIMGDLNADPWDGGSYQSAVQQLLKHPRVQGHISPRSDGARQASMAQAAVNTIHRGNPAEDTADFSDHGPGNLRVDYVLPSRGLSAVGQGVFWPLPSEPQSAWLSCSDHRLVWVDLSISR
jgi:3-phytase